MDNQPLDPDVYNDDANHQHPSPIMSPTIPDISADDTYVDGCLCIAVDKDKGRLRTVAMDDVDPLTAAMCTAIGQAVTQKNNLLQDNLERILIQQRKWQVAAAAEIMCGWDTYIVTATGSGKSMCFLLTLFARAGIVLVVSPLLALMDDQVRSAKELGINAVQITEQSIKENPDLINSVRDGEFRLVFLRPEFCLPANDHWRMMTLRKSKFVKGVFCIVIDEAHLIHQWRTFRTAYGHLSILRHTFQRAAYMLCSATMTSYTRRFVHRTLNLGPNVRACSFADVTFYS